MPSTDQAAVVVLLAEDEALVRMFAADVLREEAGFKVVEAVNADEALTILEATSDVGALVTDVEMPGSMNGFTLARVVRKGWPHIGIVIVSGRKAPEPGEMPAGAMFLAKPYRPEALIKAVASVIGPAQPPVRRDIALGQSGPVFPAGKVDGPRMGNGLEGGLAQPLPEPED